MPEPAIKNWRNFPPAGGWSLTYTLQGQSWTFTGSPKKIVEQIKNKQVVNGVYVSDTDIWNYANGVWCQRDPQRCQRELNRTPVYAPVRLASVKRSGGCRSCGGGRVR